MDEKKRCIIFLEQNGWTWDIDTLKEEYLTCYKDGYYSVDLNENEIVIIADIGDILHLPMNYYALVGALIEFRQIDCGFKNVKWGY